MKDLQTSAMTILRSWPSWSEEQRLDDDFISRVRILCPLFEPGHPIGHARFMFLDTWDPMSQDTLQDEAHQWIEEVHQYIPVAGIVQTILFEYEGLCPSRHSNILSMKVIDSLPGSTQSFEADADALLDILQYMHDMTWVPTERKGYDFSHQLRCVRSFCSYHDIADSETETILLPSTLQTGLECIIITLCRVVATLLNPVVIPMEDCLDLCRDQKGRRILSELLLLSHEERSASDGPNSPSTPPLGTPSTSPLCTPSTPPMGTPCTSSLDTPSMSPLDTPSMSPLGTPSMSPLGTPSTSNNVSPGETVIETPAPADDLDVDEPVWYSIYEKPTFQILSLDPEYTPQEISFKGRVAYHVFRGCRWVHASRQQDFYAEATILTYGEVG